MESDLSMRQSGVLLVGQNTPPTNFSGVPSRFDSQCNDRAEALIKTMTDTSFIIQYDQYLASDISGGEVSIHDGSDLKCTYSYVAGARVSKKGTHMLRLDLDDCSMLCKWKDALPPRDKISKSELLMLLSSDGISYGRTEGNLSFQVRRLYQHFMSNLGSVGT